MACEMQLISNVTTKAVRSLIQLTVAGIFVDLQVQQVKELQEGIENLGGFSPS